MAAETGTTMSANIQVTAREIDFVENFTKNWEHLQALLGIMRPIKKTPGAVLRSKEATVTLAASPAEGETTPLSEVNIVETDYEEMDVERYKTRVTATAIKDHGYDVAIAETDEAFRNELTDAVTSKFYAYLNTGTLTGSYSTWQMALAMAKGLVINKFKQIHRGVTDVVAFVNVLDLYSYIGAADITVQSAFGFQYVQDFMGYSTVFLLSEEEVAQGTVIATPIENINLYYVDPGMSDYARAGLSYTTDGETNLIGFHTEGNYDVASSESFALMGMTLFAEYLDGIAVTTVTA